MNQIPRTPETPTDERLPNRLSQAFSEDRDKAVGTAVLPNKVAKRLSALLVDCNVTELAFDEGALTIAAATSSNTRGTFCLLDDGGDATVSTDTAGCTWAYRFEQALDTALSEDGETPVRIEADTDTIHVAPADGNTGVEATIQANDTGQYNAGIPANALRYDAPAEAILEEAAMHAVQASVGPPYGQTELYFDGDGAWWSMERERSGPCRTVRLRNERGDVEAHGRYKGPGFNDIISKLPGQKRLVWEDEGCATVWRRGDGWLLGGVIAPRVPPKGEDLDLLKEKGSLLERRPA